MDWRTVVSPFADDTTVERTTTRLGCEPSRGRLKSFSIVNSWLAPTSQR